MKFILRAIGIVLVLAFLAYGGIVVKSCYDAQRPVVSNIPDIKTAKYSLLLSTTRQLYYTSDYDQFGDVLGKRVFILHGYWELRGKDFVYVKHDSPPLDEAVFGSITLTRRAK